ncbi:MAG: hypothetical protein K2K14_07680 [Ruminococcus sp.]|nr:hypothetical protein [Ruminococcus sp.]
MDIVIVTSIMNDDVHGTENDKKTGCGINLLKGDNVTKYRRGGKMNDLKDITCERCKNAFAKKMIKADKKEMARLLKEERQREKLGLADEGIIPLGNTTAKITSAPTAPEPVQPEPVPAEPPVSAAESAPTEPKQTIPGTNVAIDSSLAAFAITPPPAEEPAPQSENNDDFMAQFAVKKPEPEPEKPAPAVTNVQDDFLAQFAIPVPNQSEPEESEPEEPIDFTAINPPPSVYEEPVEKTDEADERPVGIIDEDDIMKMFAFGNEKASSSQSPAVNPSRYDYSALEKEQASSGISQENEESTSSDWDYVANQLFGVDNSEQSQSEPEQPEEMADLDLSVPESPVVPEVQETSSAPVLEDIGLPSLDDIAPVKEVSKPEISAVTAPVLDDIGLPSLDDIAPVKEVSEPEVSAVTESVTDDIELPSLDDVAPVQEADEIDEPVYEETEQEVYEEVAEPDEVAEVSEPTEQPVSTPVPPQQFTPQPEQIPVPPHQYTPQSEHIPVPLQPTPIPVQPNYVQPAQMQQPVMPQSMVGQIVSVPQFKGYDQNNQPVYMYVQMQMTGYNANGQPIYVPFGQPAQMQQPVMQQPYIPQPAPVPVQQPVSSVPKKPVVPVQPENTNQPLTPGQKIAAAAAANGGMPANASNISKIAVHEHNRSTSQAFINAIAESKEYANKSLTETQGLNSRMPVLTSIEDVLSQMGDDSEKIKQQKKAAMKNNVPVYQEYKAPSAPIRNNTAKTQKTNEPQRPLTKAELREKKKQEKIDAKFKKDLAKKGF